MPLYFGLGRDQPVREATDVRGYLQNDRKHHYQDKFSMAEAAKCWVAASPALPASIAAIVGSPVLERAHFEYPVPVWGRGVSMTDVMAFIPGGVIAIEAKVDEVFDDLIEKWIERERSSNPRSPDHRRKVVEKYAAAFGTTPASLDSIRYQLVQRTLAAAMTAKAAGLATAWMIVQDFGYGQSRNHDANRADFECFFKLVGPAPTLEGIAVRLAWVDEPAPTS